jgi:hypothetical protein
MDGTQEPFPSRMDGTQEPQDLYLHGCRSNPTPSGIKLSSYNEIVWLGCACAGCHAEPWLWLSSVT